jgi:hypothetical protein
MLTSGRPDQHTGSRRDTCADAESHRRYRGDLDSILAVDSQIDHGLDARPRVGGRRDLDLAGDDSALSGRRRLNTLLHPGREVAEP